MNRTELAQRVAEDLGMTQAEGTKAVSTVLRHIVEAVRSDPAGARIGDFGIFTVVEVPARIMRNPRSGEPVNVPAGRRVKFRPSSKLLG